MRDHAVELNLDIVTRAGRASLAHAVEFNEAPGHDEEQQVVDTSSSGDDRGQRATTDTAPFPLAPGALINGLYRLVRQLGVGGMGEVWEARHERTKGRVALKVLLPEMGRHEEVLRRFQREVEVTSALNHPNIVRVSDADKLPDGRPYLVMEFLEGHDLTTVAGRALPLGEVADIVEQTAMGLHVAHGQSVIHRDLKPANIFVVPLPGTSRTVVKILDFGISKALDGLSRLTHTRNVIGTPYYMAPEQATGGRSAMDARADQFSLAAIAYELVTGRMAFEGDGMMNVIYKVVNDPPPSFTSLGVVVPAGVEAAILRGLSKSPNDRFPSVMEFANALTQASAGAGASAESRPAAITAPMRAVQGTLILTDPPITTTLDAGVGEVATGSLSERRRIDAQRPTTPASLAAGRKTIAPIVGGAAVAIAGLIVVAVLALRGGHSDHATADTPSVAATPAPTPAPGAAAAIAAQPSPAYVRIETPALPPKKREPAVHPEKAASEEIIPPREPKHAAVVEPARAPATRKPKSAAPAGGPVPVGDSPTGIIKPPAPKKPAPRTGPLNGDL